jgi:hypothetical protein
MIYESDPNRLPDSEFVPGTIHYLVAGNEGRLLDPRRTPVKVVAVEEATGHFVVEVTSFEDAGAHWEIPFEEASRFQFHRGSDELSPSQLSVYSAITKRFDQPFHIECSEDQREQTEQRIADTRREVSQWLEAKSEFVQSGATLAFDSRDGVPSLYRDCEALMVWRGLSRVESLFAEKYVSNPNSGELVKGHRIVLAELGLVPYHGKIIRDAVVFDGDLTKPRRAEHILVRLAFVREIFTRTSNERPTLYRGMAVEDCLQSARSGTFVSASFSLDVALSHFDAAADTRSGVLYRQRVPADRLFMTYLETRQLNQQFREAEAVLLCDEASGLF